MYLDYTYIILVLPAVIFSLYCSFKVNSTFNAYSKKYSNMSGYEIARYILDTNGLTNVRVERVAGKLTDHFDPTSNVVRLSSEVYDRMTVSAIGVAAHECGHAIQYAKGYIPMKLRAIIIPITNIGARLSIPLILIGILFSYLGDFFIVIAYVGVICFAFSTLFQLITLFVEFNASNRALNTIKNCSSLTQNDYDGSKKVLTAAALTYVAALAVSFMQLLRLLLLVGRNNRRR